MIPATKRTAFTVIPGECEVGRNETSGALDENRCLSNIAFSLLFRLLLMKQYVRQSCY